LTPPDLSVPIGRVKSLLPLLFLAFAFSSCTTMSNRRDVYSPIKPDGPYTKALKTGEMPTEADEKES